jgi:hypothetical protein
VIVLNITKLKYEMILALFVKSLGFGHENLKHVNNGETFASSTLSQISSRKKLTTPTISITITSLDIIHGPVPYLKLSSTL